MAGKRKNPLWRQTFLRALARSGNVRASAFEAGVDPETAYNHRRKDPAFAAKWAAALVKAKSRPSPQPSPRSGRGGGKAGELVVRRTKNGDQLVRAGAGRWCAKAEALFFAALGQTACVRAAARACGFSTNALYQRREAYPEFAEKWDRVLTEAKRRIPDMLAAATIASLDPEAGAEAGAPRRGLPKVSVDQAIRISAIEAKKEAGGARRGDWRAIQRKQEQTKEELVQTLMTLLGAMERRQRKARLGEGWSDAGNGLLIPPGWVRDGGEGGGLGGEAEG
jgi:hypothetical protein